MFALSVSMRFAPHDFAEAQEYVRELGILSRKDQGCVEYWWAVSVDAPNTLRLFEVWESNDLLQQHLSQPHEKVWMEKFQPRVTDIEVFTYDPTTRGTIGG
jgi:quinol monooxygenase YgiN